MGVRSNRRVSLSQGWDWEDRVGLVDRGHRLSRQKLSVEQRDSVASLTSRDGRCWRSEEQRQQGLRNGWGRQVAEVAAEGNHRCGSSGSYRETHSEVDKIVVRKVQRCDSLCGTVSCENEI